jgi:hypothetical protein
VQEIIQMIHQKQGLLEKFDDDCIQCVGREYCDSRANAFCFYIEEWDEGREK